MAPVHIPRSDPPGILEEMGGTPPCSALARHRVYARFKVTEGLIDRFARRACGHAHLRDGHRQRQLRCCADRHASVAEFHSWIYQLGAFSQITNLLAKAHFRWGAPVPCIAWTAGGGVHGGPFHSQNPN